MGAWGTGVYQDDVAEDIKNDYINKQRAGKDENTALKEILEENKEIFEDDDDKYGAWYALSDTMWKYGRLTSQVKQKTIEIIEEERKCVENRWNSKKDIQKRLLVLEQLKERLMSEQPSKKRISVHKPYVPKLKKGEVYQYELSNIPDNYPQGFAFKGWYALIYIEDFYACEFTVPGVTDLLPVMYVKLSQHKISSPEEINQISSWCSDGGLKYRYKLLEVSDKYYKNLEYIGMANDFIYPEDEIIADEKDYGLAAWSLFDVDIIKGYLSEKRQRNEYEMVRNATGLMPKEQIEFERNLSGEHSKRYRAVCKEWGKYVEPVQPIENHPEHNSYICKWSPKEIYRYKIQTPPVGKERYKGWYLQINVFQLRGMELVKQGIPDIVPDVYIQVLDDKIPENLWLLDDFMPFVCYGWDEEENLGNYKAVLIETEEDKFPVEQIEEAQSVCCYTSFPKNQQEDVFPERLNWDNLVEKSLYGYERELERLGIDKENSTIDVMKQYIERMGGVHHKLNRYIEENKIRTL